MKARKRGNRKDIRRTINGATGLFFAALAAVAVREQLQRDPAERTWHGKVLGVPYDFRKPTPERLRASFWNEESSQLFVPHAFGMGWSVNFYPIFHPQPKQPDQL
jgi:hypothetical protein